MSTFTKSPKSAYVYDAVRTPFGRHGGLLSAIRPDDLAVVLENAEMST